MDLKYCQRVEKKENFSIESYYLGLYFSSENLSKEVKSVVMKKHEFKKRYESKLKALPITLDNVSKTGTSKICIENHTQGRMFFLLQFRGKNSIMRFWKNTTLSIEICQS